MKKQLKIVTAGSVDDGKSTLIGRLLYDTKSLLDDQIKQIERSSKLLGKNEFDLSLITDGLKAEREQSITIDVAYRYVYTQSRTILLADTPGHVQYTRNMATGASTADVAMILVDAQKGTTEQTRRHLYLVSLFDIRHVIFCVNKMDLVNYSNDRMFGIIDTLRSLTDTLKIRDVYYIPICAKTGDNIVHESDSMPWYGGLTLLQVLDTINVERQSQKLRFPVQYVLHEGLSYRGYAGRVSGEKFYRGQDVVVLPRKIPTKIQEIHEYGTPIGETYDGESVQFVLSDEIGVQRGDMIVPSVDIPQENDMFQAVVCWFGDSPLIFKKYIFESATHSTRCLVTNVWNRIDVQTYKTEPAPSVNMNDIVNVTIKTSNPIFFDKYKENRITGSFILIDETTFETVACGMIQ